MGGIIKEVVIPAREYLGLEVKRGQVLRLIDLEGQQVIDFVVFNGQNYEEKLSCVYSNAMNGSWRLTKGHQIYTNRGNKMWAIVADTVGLHYSGGGFCSDEYNYARWGVRGLRNCADNLTMAVAPYGLKRRDLEEGACFNVFMNVTYEPDGTWVILPPISKAGDYLELRAEMDCLVAMSNCPQERTPVNGFNPTPVKVVLYEES